MEGWLVPSLPQTPFPLSRGSPHPRPLSRRERGDFLNGLLLRQSPASARTGGREFRNAGGGQAHDNMPSWLALNYIIKT